MTDVAFEGLLDDLAGFEEAELHDLIERAHQIELLTRHKGWAYLSDYLVALTTQNQRRILSGSCKNIEEYRVQTGYVRGLQEALAAPAKLADRIARMQDRFEENVV